MSAGGVSPNRRRCLEAAISPNEVRLGKIERVLTLTRIIHDVLEAAVCEHVRSRLIPARCRIGLSTFALTDGKGRDAPKAAFADGMVEKIIIALSRIRWLFVLARNSRAWLWHGLSRLWLAALRPKLESHG